jgi:proline iminopeptidase
MENFLYNYKEPYNTKNLKVDSLHTLKIRRFGNPKGIPVIFLHGGPGAPTDNYCSRFFDKRYYNIVLFDQRGCGTSSPLSELKNNNTQELINDIEKIRLECNFRKIVLFGGSWGASLAILYMIQYPKNVLTYIIRGFCLLKENIFTESFKNMYMDNWNNFLNLGYKNSIKKTIEKYHNQIKKKNIKYIDNWINLEFNCLTVHNNSKYKMSRNDKYITSLLESYYFKNNFFIEPNFILKNANKISKIPGYIIHGRLDVICNPKDSFDLHQLLPLSRLILIEGAGHSYLDPPLTKTLVDYTKKIYNLYFNYTNKYYIN